MVLGIVPLRLGVGGGPGVRGGAPGVRGGAPCIPRGRGLRGLGLSSSWNLALAFFAALTDMTRTSSRGRLLLFAAARVLE